MKVYIVRDKYSGDIIEVCETYDVAEEIMDVFPDTPRGQISQRQDTYKYLRIDTFTVVTKQRGNEGC